MGSSRLQKPETILFCKVCAEEKKVVMASSPEEEVPVKVLSIQSHVVHGYCGNRSAVFPLQVNYLFTGGNVNFKRLKALG